MRQYYSGVSGRWLPVEGETLNTYTEALSGGRGFVVRFFVEIHSNFARWTVRRRNDPVRGIDFFHLLLLLLLRSSYWILFPRRKDVARCNCSDATIDVESEEREWRVEASFRRLVAFRKFSPSFFAFN